MTAAPNRDSPPAPPRSARLPADLAARVAIAVPAAAALVALLILGGLAFAIALGLIGAVAAGELIRMLRVAPRFAPVALLGVLALPIAALEAGRDALAPIVPAALFAAFVVALAAERGAITRGALGTLLAVGWIGICLSHGVLLRELPHGGALVLDVLLATFLGDTAAHLGGSAFGRRRLAPQVSPGKTIEGLCFGLVIGTAAVVIAAAGFQDFLEPLDALALGLACAIAAPCGDLFESMLKREAGVKDSGALLGPHGGMLDRIDACLFSAVAGYYVTIFLIV